MSLTFFPSLSLEESLLTLPTTKVRASDRTGVHSWYNDYAAFSENFAFSALEFLSSPKSSTVLDPFLGSGTSLVAASKLGLPFIGIELSPFTALLSRAKIAHNAVFKETQSILSQPKSCDFKTAAPDHLLEWYSVKDIEYANAIISKIRSIAHRSETELLKTLINPPDDSYDSIIVALVAVLISARSVSKLSKGSNPVWTRLAQKGETYLHSPLSEISVAQASKMTTDLKNAERGEKQNYRIIWGDTKYVSIPPHSVDIVITSPPYLNRLDYVISQQPELLLLSLLINLDLDELRKEMVGTTKIVEKGDPDPLWGASCIKTLKTIRSHSSKASSTYYIWNYYKYFKDIYICLNNLKRFVRPGGNGLMVIQNSHYKNVEIPINQILKEMGLSLNVEINEIKGQSVRSHMGMLSPQQRSYTPQKTLNESILYMKF